MNNIIAPVKKEMELFNEFLENSLFSDTPILEDVLAYLMQYKGKQIRPLLVLLSASMLGKITEKTYVGASVIETLHTATIIHDDVVDDSDQRRNKKSVKAIWKPKVAILVGDFLLAKSLLMVSDNDWLDFLEILVNPIREMSEGELLQMKKSYSLDTNEETYFYIIKKKTASLLAASMATGAKSVNASSEDIDKLYNIGQNLGMAFQIRDDIFDYSKVNSAGKPLGNDIIERKLTLPLIYALSKVEASKEEEVIRWIEEAGAKQENIELIINFVKEQNGLIYARKLAVEYSEKAIEILKHYPVSPSRNALIELATYSVSRDK